MSNVGEVPFRYKAPRQNELMACEVAILDGESAFYYSVRMRSHIISPVLYEGLSWQEHNEARNRLQCGGASTCFPLPTSHLFVSLCCSALDSARQFVAKLHRNNRGKYLPL
jgi:hypothetical protein